MRNKQTLHQKILFFVFIAFALIICMNGFAIRYPSRFLLPLLQAVGVMVTVFIYGFSTAGLSKKFISQTSVPQIFGLGLLVTTFIMMAASFLKMLIPGVAIYFLLALLLGFIKWKELKTKSNRFILPFFRRPVLVYALFLLPLVFASLPSSFYDTLVYHLGIPNLYLQNGGFVSTPQMLYANTSIYYEISLIPSVFVGSLTPRLFHFLVGVVFLFAVADFARRRLHLEKTNLLLLLLLSMPVTFFLLVTVKNDLLSAFFLLLVVDAFIEKQWVRCGLFAGFALGVKYFNGQLLIVFFLVMIIHAIIKKESRAVFLKGLPLVGGVSILVVLPLFIKNAIYVGNPFFPFLYQQFPTPFFDAERFGLMTADVGKLVHTVGDFIKLPFTISFEELGSGGLVGIQFLALLPFLLLRKRNRLQPPLLIFALLSIACGALFTGSIRFLFIGLVFLAIYTVLACVPSTDSPESKETEKRFNAMQFIPNLILYIIIILNAFTTLAYHEQFYLSHYLYTGKTDIEAYKAVCFPTYPAIAYVNDNTPPDSRVLMVGEARNFYLERAYTVSSALDYSSLKPYLNRSRTLGEFLGALAKGGYQYIIYNEKEFFRLQKVYNRVTEEELAKWLYFKKNMKPVYHEGALYVFSVSQGKGG